MHNDLWGADVKFTMGLEIEADCVCSHNLREKGWVRFDFIFSCGFQVEVLKHLFTFPNLWYAPPLRWPWLNENIQVSMAKWAKSRKRKLKMSAHNGENFNKNLVWSFLCFQLDSASNPFLFLWGRVNSDALLPKLTGQSTGCFHSRLPSFLFFDQVSCNLDWLQTLYVSDDELLELLILLALFGLLTCTAMPIHVVLALRSRLHARWVRTSLRTPTPALWEYLHCSIFSPRSSPPMSLRWRLRWPTTFSRCSALRLALSSWLSCLFLWSTRLMEMHRRARQSSVLVQGVSPSVVRLRYSPQAGMVR